MSNNKIQKNKPAQTEEEKQLETNQKLSEIILSLEKKDGLEIKSGNLADQRINVCRGKQLSKLFNDNKEEIAKKILEITKIDIGPKGPKALQNFYEV